MPEEVPSVALSRRTSLSLLDTAPTARVVLGDASTPSNVAVTLSRSHDAVLIRTASWSRLAGAATRGDLVFVDTGRGWVAPESRWTVTIAGLAEIAEPARESKDARSPERPAVGSLLVRIPTTVVIGRLFGTTVEAWVQRCTQDAGVAQYWNWPRRR